MPIKPYSALPPLIAQACSEALERRLVVSGLYTHDSSALEVWHSRILKEQEGSQFYENRRITLFDLNYPLPPGPLPQNLELSTVFNGKEGPQITIARLAIHEVHRGWEHNFEGQKNPEFCLTDHGWTRKVGLEFTTNTTDPLRYEIDRMGRVSILPVSQGVASDFDAGEKNFDLEKHGDYLVYYARFYLQNHLDLFLPPNPPQLA